MDKKYLKCWNDEQVVNFFISNRKYIEDVYPSEKYFLDEYLQPGMRALDYGCAAGGFCNILKNGYHLPYSNYWGVDQSFQMIETARQLYPRANFETDLNEIFKKKMKFDLVFSFGVLHMTFNWEKILHNLYHLASKYLIFDLRIITGETTIENIDQSFQTLSFNKATSGEEIECLNVPYIILNNQDVENRLSKIYKKRDRLLRYSYTRPVSETVTSPYSEVEMTSFCIIKRTERQL
ncbi:conserved hypothetical protein [Candidatus Desulfarcum epimagneticum]|uniref:Methyltransferase domain-containing protein n=1 Tax=uncultured Desulfobacteraceae bacterium TaxID=218296 RepID=A0A484HLL3_9BACT|nr:conserved hypothetical protein [uncultured Desulfobacteraceae bacterium]